MARVNLQQKMSRRADDLQLAVGDAHEAVEARLDALVKTKALSPRLKERLKRAQARYTQQMAADAERLAQACEKLAYRYDDLESEVGYLEDLVKDELEKRG